MRPLTFEEAEFAANEHCRFCADALVNQSITAAIHYLECAKRHVANMEAAIRREQATLKPLRSVRVSGRKGIHV